MKEGKKRNGDYCRCETFVEDGKKCPNCGMYIGPRKKVDRESNKKIMKDHRNGEYDE